MPFFCPTVSNLSFSTCGNATTFDSVLTLYDEFQFIELYRADDGCSDGDGAKLIINDLTPGSLYYLELSASPTVAPPVFGTFRLESECTTPSPVTPTPTHSQSMECGDVLNGTYDGLAVFYLFSGHDLEQMFTPKMFMFFFVFFEILKILTLS